MNELVKVINQAFGLPALLDSAFPSKVLRDFDSWDPFYTTDVFPYDIKVSKDKDGNITKTDLIFAIAGVGKGDVNIKVDHDWLTVSIEQSEETKDESVEYVRKGLSHRSMVKRFYLRDADKQNIKSKVENGLLTITIPPSPESGKRVYKVDVE